MSPASLLLSSKKSHFFSRAVSQWLSGWCEDAARSESINSNFFWSLSALRSLICSDYFWRQIRFHFSGSVILKLKSSVCYKNLVISSLAALSLVKPSPTSYRRFTLAKIIFFCFWWCFSCCWFSVGKGLTPLRASSRDCRCLWTSSTCARVLFSMRSAVLRADPGPSPRLFSLNPM